LEIGQPRRKFRLGGQLLGNASRLGLEFAWLHYLYRMQSRIAIVFALLMPFFGQVAAQSIKILHAPHGTRSLESGKALQADYNLLAEEKISLPDANAKVLVWDEFDGLCILKAQQKGKKLVTEGTVKSFKQQLDPTPLWPRQPNLGSISGIKLHLENRELLLLGDSYFILDSNQIRLDGDIVFWLHFREEFTGGQIDRPLLALHDTLLFYPRLILEDNGIPIDPRDVRKFDLYYMHKNQMDFNPVCSFDMIMPSNTQLSHEVGLLLDQLMEKGEPLGRQKAWVNTFLLEAFGRAETHNLEDWLGQNFPLSFPGKKLD
jgi:hypothetical protein